MKKIIENKLFKQIMRFGVVGVTAFIIDYTILFILTEFAGIPALLSAAISFTVSVIFNYILSIKWVFDVQKEQTAKEVIIFIVLSVIGLGINELIIYGGECINIHYMISKIFATAVVMVYNFITRKIFIEK